jgi:opacity protein-like surface antigen
MKRISMLIGAAAICCASYAHSTPYVGVDIHKRQALLLGKDANVIHPRPLGLSVHVGKMLDNNFAIESGYKFSKSIKDKARLEMKSLRATFMGYLPLESKNGLTLLAGFGLSHLQHKAEHPAYEVLVSGAVPHAMAGFEYSIFKSLSSRFMFDWENAKALTKAEKRFNNVYGLSAGLKFSFL